LPRVDHRSLLRRTQPFTVQPDDPFCFGLEVDRPRGRVRSGLRARQGRIESQAVRAASREPCTRDLPKGAPHQWRLVHDTEEIAGVDPKQRALRFRADARRPRDPVQDADLAEEVTRPERGSTFPSSPASATKTPSTTT